MKHIFFKGTERGSADHGWLKANFMFSFAGYYNPERMNFGALRVFNDDLVEPGKGFHTHPHDNMEIVTIPIRGKIEHRDSMGHQSIIGPGDVQVMSAGTGVFHSEMNPSDTDTLNIIQTWVFPRKKGLKPAYGEESFPIEGRTNQWQNIVGPDEAGGRLMVNQDAWYYLGNFDANQSFTLDIKGKDSGLFIFAIEGEAKVNGTLLNTRDAIGIWDTSAVNIETLQDSKFIAIEVPMTF